MYKRHCLLAEKGERGLKKTVKRILKGDLMFFIFSAMGILFGLLLALIFCRREDAPAFAGGFAHAFPGDFSPRALAFAVLFQALPMAVLYYSGYGVLVKESGCLVLFFRSFLGGYCTVAASRIGAFSQPLFAVLFVLFVLFELLTISFHASFAYLAQAFSKVIVRNKSICAIKKYTRDFLFFYGLILFFYIARGCIVALMNL